MGSLVARIIRQNTDETILCVCYTNHALDQFLDHMLDAGERRLVRIGGRTKSQRIEPYQLHHLAKKKSLRDATSVQRIKQVDAQLYKLRDQLNTQIAKTRSSKSWKDFREYFESELPHVLQFLLAPKSSDGFEMVGQRGKKVDDDYFWKLWSEGQEFPPALQHLVMPEDIESFQNFWSASATNRIERKNTWHKDLMQGVHDEIRLLSAEIRDLTKERQVLQQAEQLQILRSARIIGATTSGAAKNRELLSGTPGVVLVEEAGEVLESHVLTSLVGGEDDTIAVKHLILIGDHKQLRPKVENYDLTVVSGQGYNLDLSLFERLILASLPSVSLEVQRKFRRLIKSIQLTTSIRPDASRNIVAYSRTNLSVSERPRISHQTSSSTRGIRQPDFHRSCILRGRQQNGRRPDSFKDQRGRGEIMY